MRTRPLTLAAVGLVAIALDMRVVAWDLLPDVVGWVLIALGAWRLTMRSAAALAVAAAVASLAEVHIPYRYDAIDPLTGEVVVNPRPGLAYHELLAFNPVSGGRLLLLAVTVAAGAAGLWILLRELARRAVAVRRPLDRPRLRLLAVGGGPRMGGPRPCPHAGAGAVGRRRVRPGVERRLGDAGADRTGGAARHGVHLRHALEPSLERDG